MSILAVCASSGILAACGAGSSLSTGSLFGSGDAASAQAPPAAKPVTATDRAVYVAGTIARAQRCGFYFDPESVRSNYLAAEQQGGTPPEAMQRVTKEFDYTRRSVIEIAAKDDAYCTEGRTREVKTALNRQLTGDFNPPQQRQEIAVGLFDHQKKDRPLDGQKVFDASQKRIGPSSDY